MARWRRFLPPLLAMALAAGCGQGNEGALQVVFIDDPETLFSRSPDASGGARHVNAAIDVGLVQLNAEGDVIPALADRWIVTDDGRSFIFRLRDGTWPDGSELTAESARTALRARLRALRRTALGLDLYPIDEVRAMAGRVVEIRLSSPLPSLLLLLAQPELALRRGEGGSGEMRLTREEQAGVLSMKPPSALGVPEAPDWQDYVRQIDIRAADAPAAVRAFDEGAADVVLGGTIGALPLANTGPLSRGTVRLDPAIGLFGLQVRRSQGFLSTDQGREALAMALDRPTLIAPFNIAGWIPTTRIVAPDLPGDQRPVTERWSERTIEELRSVAAARVTAWRLANDGAPVALTLAIGRAPGLDMLFDGLSRQFASIGVALERVPPGYPADLALVDRVARYAEPRWFLNQLHCSLDNGLCVAAADRLVRQSLEQLDPAVSEALLTQAEAELTAANVFIPIGSPLRFSLVRSGVDGFAANPWAFHPLPALARLPR